jgi:hypothetical protein
MMINVFEETPAKKEKYVIDMLERGYSYSQIMKECHVSPKTISDVKKRFFGSTNDLSQKNAGKLSKETEALKLFKEGKKALDIALELDLPTDSVIQIQKDFYKLIGLDEYTRVYEQVYVNIVPFLELYNAMNRLGMNPEQFSEAVKNVNALPQLQNYHTNLSNEIHILEYRKYNLNSQLNSITNQVVEHKRSLVQCTNEDEQKRFGISILDYQIKNKQNLIQELDNQEGYQRIKKESTEQTKSIIKNNPLLMAVTVYSTVEAIRRHPNNQQLLYDLSVRKGYSALNEETWIQSYTTQLLQLSEQVRIEIAEQITKMVVSKIQENDSNTAGILVVSHGQTPPAMTHDRQSIANKI